MPPSSSPLPGDYRLCLEFGIEGSVEPPFRLRHRIGLAPFSADRWREKGEGGHPFCRAGAEVLGRQLVGLHLVMYPAHPTIGNCRYDHVLLLTASE